jgi:hypothetical protein
MILRHKGAGVTKPFILVVDGLPVVCQRDAKAVFQSKEHTPVQEIEVYMADDLVKVSIHKDDGTIEEVRVHRGEGGLPSELHPNTHEEALENLHDSLLNCIECDVPPVDLFSYLLSRISELGLAVGMPPDRFKQVCQDTYETAMVSKACDQEPLGEA